MLVLSRKVGERILVGSDITITVVRMGQGVVRIGIEAPLEIPVYREEVFNTIRRDGESANPRGKRQKKKIAKKK